MKLRHAFATAALLAMTGGAHAENVPLKDLLGQGFVIVSTNLIPGDVSAKALGSQDIQEELLIVMQRASEVAFCHLYFAATYSNDSIPDAGCFRPAGTVPTPPPASCEPLPPPSEQPSTEGPRPQTEAPASAPAN